MALEAEIHDLIALGLRGYGPWMLRATGAEEHGGLILDNCIFQAFPKCIS